MPQANPGRTVTRDDALALHRAGNVAKALLVYEALLKKDPKNADILGLAGIAQYQLGKQPEAKASWIECMSMDSEAPIMLRNMSNLLSALLEENNVAELQFLIDLPMPEWPAGLAPSAAEKNTVISLARGLLQIGREPAALKLLENVSQCIADDAAYFKDAAELLLKAGYADQANALLQRLSELDQEIDGGLMILRAAAAFAAGQHENALRLTKNAVEAMPFHLTAKVASQTLLLGVLNEAPKLVEKQVSPQMFHFFKNSAADFAWKFNGDYRFLSIFPEALSIRGALVNLPQPDLIWNNWVSAETLSTPNNLKFISEFADSFGLSVLNHPRKAAETTRQRNAERLAGIPHLVVPRIMRFFNEAKEESKLARAIGTNIGFPVIIRNPFTQMGKATAVLNTPADLEEHLMQIPGRQLYAIEYVQNPSTAGIYRKIRAAVIGDDIFIVHVHFDRKWNVHGNKGKKLEFELPRATLHFAETLISNPLTVIGEAGMSALGEIRNRIPLDFFGIDFDIMPDGRLLFFEANAAMKISLADRPGKEEMRANMRAALGRLFEEARNPHV